MRPQTFARAFAAIALAAFAAITFVQGGDVDATWLRPASLAATVAAVVAVGLEWVAPRARLTRWVFKLPDIRGTWAATLRPSELPDGVTSESEIPAYIVIRHTLSDITVDMFTEEGTSHSTSAAIASTNGTRYLVYTYRGDPRDSVRHRSPVHDGATKLRISLDSHTLEGRYWTDRMSRGELVLSRRLTTKPIEGFSACAELDEADSPHVS